ncbi:MAG TPA: potassium channel family protein [Methylomirabilota bacterium]|jgi:hypothetical protein|nr:potassium channel family protein [Methylomirabilota bacterium]
MRLGVGIVGIVLIAAIIWDAFEALVLPRRVTRRLRPTRWFYRSTWGVWSAIARRLRQGGRRETYLSFYGPLSLFLLLAMWAASLIIGFGMLHWASGSSLVVQGAGATFWDDLYMSGTTFFTLGLGDVVPRRSLARVLTVVEGGVGFGFLAVVIGYLPVLYQAFARREVSITLLDARAGSPPSAGELLRRNGRDTQALAQLLHEWERWSAEILESHLSYPVLGYFRSQHDNQSWLAALTAILDSCALVIVAIEGACARQAQLTFAIARHAAVDLAQVLGAPPGASVGDRLPPAAYARLRSRLGEDGVILAGGAAAEARFAALRRMYEPYVTALAARLLMPLPEWDASAAGDNWRTSAWERRVTNGGALGERDVHDDA